MGTPDTLQREPTPAPVFVDRSGRRRRRLRVVGWVLGILLTGYVAALTASLFVSPGLIPLSVPGVGSLLPGPAAPLLSGGDTGRPRRPAEVVPSATSTTPAATVPAAPTAPTASATSAPTPPSTPTPTPRPSATGSPTATPTHGSQPTSRPTPTSSRSGQSTSHPTPRSRAT